VKVIGVQSNGADAIVQSFSKKQKVCTLKHSTIADGIAVNNPGDVALDLIFQNVDDVITVLDEDIPPAILLLLERCKLSVEPAGAISLAAALYSNKIDIKGKKVLCLLSGGNIDVLSIDGFIQLGLKARHRSFAIFVVIQKGPDSIKNLLDTIGEAGGQVVEMAVVNSILTIKANEAMVCVRCETNGLEHCDEIVKQIEELGCTVYKEEELEKYITKD
ncbi:MAG: pyridoxal-phosphate dependent enzyme, partial [Coriobacteriales bacterium]|nr:pyridoxal-phosphate dependent enzyme [Coriobacteriales bacterium]